MVQTVADMEPKLYSLFAEWWPLFSPRSDYQEAATIYRRYL